VIFGIYTSKKSAKFGDDEFTGLGAQEEAYIDSEGIQCDLDIVKVGVQRDTDKKILKCRQKSNLNILQKDINLDQIDTDDLFDNKDLEQKDTKKHEHVNITLEELAHAESSPQIYSVLRKLGNPKQEPDLQNFYAVLSEDFNGESTTKNLQATWLGQKGEDVGVFGAIHPNQNGVGVGEITNKTYIEYKKNGAKSSELYEEIINLKKDVLRDAKKNKAEMLQIHDKFLTENLNIKNDIDQKIFTALPFLESFLDTKFNIKETAQLDFSSPENENSSFEYTFNLSKNETIAELKKVNIILNDEAVIVGNVTHSLLNKETKALEKYRKVLVKQLNDSQYTEVQSFYEKNNPNEILEIQIKKKNIELKIEEKQKEIDNIKNKPKINHNRMAILEQDILYLNKELDIYSGIFDDISSFYPNETAYNEIFENITKDGEIVATKVKNVSSTIFELRKYHEWIIDKMFAGVSPPSNEDVKAILVSSAYRGDFSPQKLNKLLLALSDKQSQDIFYEIVLKISDSQNEQADAVLKELTDFLNDKFPDSFNDMKSSLLKSAENWNNSELVGNKYKLDENHPLTLKETDSIQAFEKQWGFNINLAYKHYKESKTKTVNPISIDYQNNKKINANALDVSLWITRDIKSGKESINDSEEMKNYLSDLLKSILENINGGDVYEKIDNLKISDEKKSVYKSIIDKDWEKNDTGILLFVKTLKSEFGVQQNIEEKYNLKNTYAAVQDSLKKISGDTDVISDTVSYAWEMATDGDVAYMGLFAGLGYLLLKNTSSDDTPFWMSWLKKGLVTAGVVGGANYFIKDASGVDMVGKVTDLIIGNDKYKGNPTLYAKNEIDDKKLREDENGEEIISEDILMKAGTCVSSANLKEVLIWYNECDRLSNNSEENSVKNIYNNKVLPSGIKKTMSIIYEASGNVGEGKGKEDEAKAAYTFVDLYLRNISLKLNPNAGDGRGNPTNGYRYLADKFIFTDDAGKKNTYEENGVLKTGYRFGTVIRSLTSSEKMEKIYNKKESVSDYADSAVDSVDKFGNELVASVKDEGENTDKTNEKITQATTKELTKLT